MDTLPNNKQKTTTLNALFDQKYRDLFEERVIQTKFGKIVRFICKTCQKPYVSKSNATRHICPNYNNIPLIETRNLKLNSIHFGLFELNISYFKPETNSPFSYHEEGYACALCGEPFGDCQTLREHIVSEHTEWFTAVWLTLTQCDSLKQHRKNIYTNVRAWFLRNRTEFARPVLKFKGLFDQEYNSLFDWDTKLNLFICKSCHRPFRTKSNAVKHLRLCRLRPIKKQRKHCHYYHLKPWKDTESLFCDTEFLEMFIGKEPLKGDECRDD